MSIAYHQAVARASTVSQAEIERLRPELLTFLRQLPGLIDEEQEGRYVVIKGDTTFDTWDTYADAAQFASRQFPDGQYLVQRIDRRFQRALEDLFGEQGSRREAVAA